LFKEREFLNTSLSQRKKRGIFEDVYQVIFIKSVFSTDKAIFIKNN
jgi:hypothetical protein